MSSPLFRWTFDTPKKSDSEETFCEEAEENGVNERNFQNEDMDTKVENQVPMLRNFYSSDSLANEELSQDLLSPLVPVARNDFPSWDSTSSNLNHVVRNNTGVSKFNDNQDCLKLVEQNSQSRKWTADKSQTDALGRRKKWPDSSAETFFEEDQFRAEDRTSVRHSSPSLLRGDSHESICDDEEVVEIMSPKILTGLNDTQFNAYPTECKSQAASTDATFFEEENAKQFHVENYSQQRSSAQKTDYTNQVDFQMSPEILTGLNDSQFNAYPTECKSQAASTDATFFEGENAKQIHVENYSQHCSSAQEKDYNKQVDFEPEILTGLDDSQFNAYVIKGESQVLSTDATFFDVSENRNEVYAVEPPTSVKEKLGDVTRKDAVEIHDNLSADRISLNQRINMFEDSSANTESRACLNTDLSQDMVDFMEKMSACPLLDMRDLKEIVEEIILTDSSDRDDLSVILDETLEDFEQLRLSSVQTSSPKEPSRPPGNQRVATKQKRVASPRNFGENKRRKTAEVKSAQNLRPMGKPSISRIKEGMKTPSREPRTPCHPMSLRLRKGWSVENSPQCYTPDSLSGKKSCWEKESNYRYLEFDFVKTPKRNVNTPKRLVNTPKRNANTPKTLVNTPKRNANTPKTLVNTPKRNANTPKRNVNTPKRNANTPKSKFPSQDVKSTPQVFSSKSVQKKTSSQGKKGSNSDPDYVGASPHRKRHENLPRSARENTQTPSFDVSIKRQGKTIPKSQLTVTFDVSPFNQKVGRGRPKKIVQSDFKDIDAVSDKEEGNQSKLSINKHSLRKSPQPVSKFVAVQSGKQSRMRLVDSKAENSVNDQLVLLRQDETSLRSMRQRLLDIIFDELPLSMDEAEYMSREIREKQQRIEKWNQPDVEDKVCRLVKELETLCENMLYQIQSLVDSSSDSNNLPVPETNDTVYQRNDTKQELKSFSGWRSQTKTKVSKKSNLIGIANCRRRNETPARQEKPPEPKLKKRAFTGGSKHLPTSSGNFVSPRGDILPPSQSSEQKTKTIQETNLHKEEKIVLKTPKLDRIVANLPGRRKVTPSKVAENVRHSERPEYSRVLMDNVRSLTGMGKARRVESPRPPPVKLVSSQDLREDTLAEQTFSGRSGKEGPTADRLATNVCRPEFVCEVCSKKTVVDIGTNTDFVEPQQKIKKTVLVDRSTNTDPDDFDRRCKRKELVEIGTNTEFNYNGNPKSDLLSGRKVLNSVSGIANKENIGTKLDLKHVTHVWLPNPEDFLPCSYDYLTPEFLANNPNAEIPQELIDDLTWDD